MVTVGTEPSV